jgi:hypothetical protein
MGCFQMAKTLAVLEVLHQRLLAQAVEMPTAVCFAKLMERGGGAW